MAEENRPAPRGVGRGYSGYDRHGNYDPYGDLLRFREDEDPGASRDEGLAASRGGYAAWEDSDEAPVARVRSRRASSSSGARAGRDRYDFDEVAPARGGSRRASSAPGARADRDRYDFDEVAPARGGSRRASSAPGARGDGDRYDLDRTTDAPRTAGRRKASATADSAAGAGRRDASRAASPRTAAALLPQAPTWTAPAALILGPLIGVLAGQALGSASGPAFAVAAVLAAMLAAAAVPRRTLWWVVPAAPPVIWLTSAAAELTLNSSGAQDGADGRMIALTHATVHAFPVMTAALAAALCVVLAGHVLARADRAPRPDHRGPSHA